MQSRLFPVIRKFVNDHHIISSSIKQNYPTRFFSQSSIHNATGKKNHFLPSGPYIYKKSSPSERKKKEKEQRPRISGCCAISNLHPIFRSPRTYIYASAAEARSLGREREKKTSCPLVKDNGFRTCAFSRGAFHVLFLSLSSVAPRGELTRARIFASAARAIDLEALYIYLYI